MELHRKEEVNNALVFSVLLVGIFLISQACQLPLPVGSPAGDCHPNLSVHGRTPAVGESDTVIFLWEVHLLSSNLHPYLICPREDTA